jgi:hypothetical protein
LWTGEEVVAQARSYDALVGIQAGFCRWLISSASLPDVSTCLFEAEGRNVFVTCSTRALPGPSWFIISGREPGRRGVQFIAGREAARPRARLLALMKAEGRSAKAVLVAREGGETRVSH